jgi:hypothetical protein
MPKLHLISITCHEPDETDKDEIYLKYRDKKIWPKGKKFIRIDTDQKVKVDTTLDITSGWKEIELWEFDFMSKNDHLGTFYLKVDDAKGTHQDQMEVNSHVTDRAKYSIEWKISDQ